LDREVRIFVELRLLHRPGSLIEDYSDPTWGQMRQLPSLQAISSDALRRPDWTRIAKSVPASDWLVTLGRGFNLKPIPLEAK
jgi:hypothetical protein